MGASEANPKYNSNRTTVSADTLKTDVTKVLQTYGDTELKDFNKPFRHSVVTGLVDDVSDAIVSNTLTILLGKWLLPSIAKSTSYTIAYNNTLYNPHTEHNKDSGGIISSTGFKVSGDTTNVYYFDDDGAGNLRRYYLVGSTRTYVDNSAGTINYVTGIVTINGISIASVEAVDGVSSKSIRITAIPNSMDVVPLRNQLLELDMTNSTVVAEVDTIEVSEQGGATAYTATPNNPTASSF